MKFIKFHGIPWNFKISFKISFQCSLKLILIKKFHGTFSRVPWNFLNNIWTTPVVPWNSMELEQQNLKFHGIPCNSTEFCPDPKFHGIPWNFFHTPEFHGIPWHQITSLTIVYSTVYSDVDQRKHQSPASLAFVRGIHRSPHANGQ